MILQGSWSLHTDELSTLRRTHLDCLFNTSGMAALSNLKIFQLGDLLASNYFLTTSE